MIHLEINNNRIIRVDTTRASYSSAIVLNAAGAWAGEIGKLAGLDLPIHPDSHGIQRMVSGTVKLNGLMLLPGVIWLKYVNNT